MTRPRSEAERRAEQAADAFQAADEIDAKPRIGFGDDIVFNLDAKTARERAQETLQPPADLVEGCGESVTRPCPNDFSNPTLEVFANTLARPTSVSVAASEHRLRAAKGAGILVSALDAAHALHAPLADMYRFAKGRVRILWFAIPTSRDVLVVVISNTPCPEPNDAERHATMKLLTDAGFLRGLEDYRRATSVPANAPLN